MPLLLGILALLNPHHAQQDPSYRRAYELPLSYSEVQDEHQESEEENDSDDGIVRAMMQRPINMERLRFSWLTCAADRWRHEKVGLIELLTRLFWGFSCKFAFQRSLPLRKKRGTLSVGNELQLC